MPIKIMKINTIVLIMTIMLLSVISASGYYLYYAWNSSVEDNILEQSETTVKILQSEFNTYLTAQRKPVKTLANMPAIIQSLQNKTAENLQQANHLLDIFCATLETLTCYLMDQEGMTIASSNRDSKKSFVGKNFSFRPYFRNAILAKPFIYLALGITSKKRGIYFSHAVTFDNKIIGVVVVKTSVLSLEQKFANSPGIIALTGPDGMVFASNRADWLYKSLWKLSPEKIEQLIRSKQFANELPGSIGLVINNQGRAVNSDADIFFMTKKELSVIPGWQLTYLYDTKKIAIQQSENLNLLISSSIGVLLLFIGTITLLLNKFARREIQARKQIEQNLIEERNVSEKANKAKSEFISSMNHELRTPMTAIIGYSQLIELDEHLPAEQKENIRHVLMASYHLLTLINDVLDLAKVESGCTTLVFESVDVSSVVEECLVLVKTLVDKRDIHLSCTGLKGAIVQADRTRLKQVLLNLISNAIKYNHRGGSVEVNIQVDESKQLHLSVTDSGPGISDAHLLELFQPFNRLHAENSDIEGTGIGLTLSRSIIKMMGGTIGVESTLGKGSTFWIELK